MTRTAISPRLAITTLLSTRRHSDSVLIDERVRRHLAAATRFTDIEVLDVTDSTNRVVAEPGRRRRSRGAGGGGRPPDRRAGPPGPVLGGRTGHRPAGVDPPAPERPAARPAGICSPPRPAWPPARPAQQVGGFSPDLKWPNDLLVGDRKLAGILAEAAGGAVVIGMGLQRPRAAPPGAAWVDEAAGRRVDRSDLLGAWLAALDG